MKKPIMTTVVQSTIETDVYCGEKCEDHENHFRTYCNGDKQDDTHQHDFTICLHHHPAGTEIVIEEPLCPDCESFRQQIPNSNKFVDRCMDCGFDWKNWEDEQYS